MYYSGLVILTLLAVSSTYASNNLAPVEARYGTVTYDPNGKDLYIANLTLTNTGRDDIDSGSQNVSIYVCFIRLVLNSNTAEGAVVSTSPLVTVYHLDGCAHKIVFSSPFQLEAKESLSLTLRQQFWLVAYTDVMPSWYIQLGDGPHQLISNTNDDSTQFTDPFDTPQKYLRSAKDLILPFTVEDRYSQQTKLYPAHSADEVRTRLVPDVLELPISDTTEYVHFPLTWDQLQPTIKFSNDANLKKGQFTLQVAGGGETNLTIITQSGSTADKQTAISTVSQMFERFNNTLPTGSHTSTPPRFEYRGYMLDIARQFHIKSVIMRQLDLMWRYKLNVLHLHLIDDESWAIEIDGIPELTEIGSKQCFDMDQCATYPQLGRQLTNSVQYLTKADYEEIVRHAESLGIMVIPEVELPGHSTAAVHAMRKRYENSPSAEDYRLHDPEDESEYQSVQYFTQGAMNPCVNSMYAFLNAVVTALKSYHNNAGQPLSIIHLAGDEVATGAWTDSPACQDIIGDASEAKEKTNAVKIHMMKKIGELAENESLALGFWEDGLINKTSGRPFIKDLVFPASVDVYGYTWQTVWEWWGGDRAFNLANGGYKVVMTPATHYYLDHPQEPHPNEHGYYWATRYSSLKTAYSFRPINYYANIDGVKRFGAPITEESWCNPSKCPPLRLKENIVGVEGPLFGETIQTEEHIDNNAWPRLMAIAERGWTEAVWEKYNGSYPYGFERDFDVFRQVLEQYEIPAIEDSHNVKYHLSPPGAKIAEETTTSVTLQLSVEFKGQRVWWREESEQDYIEAPSHMITFPKDSKIFLKTSNAAGTRYSYEVSYKKPKTPPTVQPTAAADSSSNPLKAAVSLLLSTVLITACLN